MKLGIFGLLLITASCSGLAAPGVSVNGMHLDPAVVKHIEQRLGRSIPRGNYRVNSNSGCWSSNNGSSGCVDPRMRDYYQKRLQQHRSGAIR